MNFIQVRFANSPRLYMYRNHISTVAVNDYVVVNTPSGGMQVVKVVEIDCDVPKFPCKWIVDTVDTLVYNELTSAEMEKESDECKSRL